MNYLEQRSHLLTEQVNPNSENLDLLSNEEIVDLFNREDAKTIEAIAKARQALAKAIELTSLALGQGGRLFYIGAGTSGRLGVLDAAECPPTPGFGGGKGEGGQEGGEGRERGGRAGGEGPGPDGAGQITTTGAADPRAPERQTVSEPKPRGQGSGANGR